MPVFFEHALRDLAIVTGLIVACGYATAHILRKRHLRWTWALPGLPIGFLLVSGNPLIALPLWGASLYACALRARWHREDLEHGAHRAEISRARVGIVGLVRPPGPRAARHHHADRAGRHQHDRGPGQGR
jgi:hypothetical protein